MGKVIAICTSPAKGTQKTRIEEGTFIEDFGLEGDAHAGKWQTSKEEKLPGKHFCNGTEQMRLEGNR